MTGFRDLQTMELAVRRFLLHSQTMELAVCVALSGRVFLSSRPDCVLTFREKGPGLMGVVTPRGLICLPFAFACSRVSGGRFIGLRC